MKRIALILCTVLVLATLTMAIGHGLFFLAGLLLAAGWPAQVAFPVVAGTTACLSTFALLRHTC